MVLWSQAVFRVQEDQSIVLGMISDKSMFVSTVPSWLVKACVLSARLEVLYAATVITNDTV